MISIIMQTYPIVSGISIIIPNYNGRLLLQEILPCALKAAENAGVPYEIIVCDDSSTDDSVYFLRQQYPGIKVFSNDLNRGFSPTINTGIFNASYSHVLLLNSDMKLCDTYFNSLFRYFERPDTFGVMGRIVGWDNDKVLDGGKVPAFHGVKIKTSINYLPVEKSGSAWLYSMYLSGANAFVDKQKIIELGGFDELFAPFYVEDYELSLRAWRMGWKCYYDDNAVCRHKHAASIKASNSKERIKVLHYRNKMYLHAIHLSQPQRFLWFVQLFMESVMYLLIFRMRWFKSLNLFIRNYSGVVESRKRLNSVAKGKHLRSVNEVADLVNATIRSTTVTRF